MAGLSRLQDPLINRKIKVGTFNTTIEIGNPAAGTSATLEALVDTGATLTVVAGSLLRRLGVEPIRQQAFELGRWPPGGVAHR